MIKIPLHCLVVLVGTTGSGKTQWALDQFHACQILNFKNLTESLTGRADNQLHKELVWSNMVKTAEQRLSLGNRVVVDHTNLSRQERDTWISLSEQLGVMCFFVLIDQPKDQKISCLINQGMTKQSAETTLSFQQPYYQKFAMRQHSLGNWVRVIQQNNPISVVSWPTLHSHNQLLAVGDVHGNHVAMKAAVDLAREQKRTIVWLGDIVDYGSANLKCVKLAYNTVNEGNAVMIWGNHDRKIARWIASNWGHTYRGKLSESNKITVREIESLDVYQRTRFLAAWTALENWSQQSFVSGNWMFSHGAADPEMFDCKQHRLPQPLADLAMYGEICSTSPTREDGYPNRVWKWIDRFDSHHRVVVGHSWLDREKMTVVEKTGAKGAKVYCVDTGSSKGGVLTALAIDVQSDSAVSHALE
jgi:protein phosphatase